MNIRNTNIAARDKFIDERTLIMNGSIGSEADITFIYLSIMNGKIGESANINCMQPDVTFNDRISRHVVLRLSGTATFNDEVDSTAIIICRSEPVFNEVNTTPRVIISEDPENHRIDPATTSVIAINGSPTINNAPGAITKISAAYKIYSSGSDPRTALSASQDEEAPATTDVTAVKGNLDANGGTFVSATYADFTGLKGEELAKKIKDFQLPPGRTKVTGVKGNLTVGKNPTGQPTVIEASVIRSDRSEPSVANILNRLGLHSSGARSQSDSASLGSSSTESKQQMRSVCVGVVGNVTKDPTAKVKISVSPSDANNTSIPIGGEFRTLPSANQLTKEMKEYINTFEGKAHPQSFSELRLPLTEIAKLAECIIPGIGTIPNTPVFLHGNLRDFESLRQLKETDGFRTDPITKKEFSLSDIQPAFAIRDKIARIIRENTSVSSRPSESTSLSSSSRRFGV